MNSISKDILDKLRQLSDLLIVIKDSGNNTPQILKELAVEKCSEIYNIISSGEVIDEEATSNESIVDSVDEIISENIADSIIDEIDNNMPSVEKDIVEELNTIEDIEPQIEVSLDDVKDEPIIEEEVVNSDVESMVIEEEILNIDIEESVSESEKEYTDNIILTEEDSYNEIDIFEGNNEIESVVVDDEGANNSYPTESFKKCTHKKIRSVLSINDIFLYKRELFGNSDVDMTDMFDGIDEAESLENAMEIINEYFGSDVDSEEMVIEFIERVKQCFE